MRAVEYKCPLYLLLKGRENAPVHSPIRGRPRHLTCCIVRSQELREAFPNWKESVYAEWIETYSSIDFEVGQLTGPSPVAAFVQCAVLLTARLRPILFRSRVPLLYCITIPFVFFSHRDGCSFLAHHDALLQNAAVLVESLLDEYSAGAEYPPLLALYRKVRFGFGELDPCRFAALIALTASGLLSGRM